MTATAVPLDASEYATELEALRREQEGLRARLVDLQHRLEQVERQFRRSGDMLPVVSVVEADGPPPLAAPGDAPSLRDLIGALTAGAAWSRPPEKDVPFLTRVSNRLQRWTWLCWPVGAVGLALVVTLVLLRLWS
jgi:hypothetical protein